jgi:predicted amidohydrolase YtcJ
MADATVFVGSVFDSTAAQPRQAAVLVRGGRIAAVTGSDRADELFAAGAEVVDIGDGLLVPGFQDAHVHPVYAGAAMTQCDLHGLRTEQESVDRVRQYAEQHPDRPWITGGGWSMEAFPGGLPTRQLLDAVVPDRPVYLPNRDGHGAWVNSRALDLAGITRDTPDPIDGRIERDADGEPLGTLQEGASQLVSRLLPELTAADYDLALDVAQQYLFSLGITGWQDAIIGEVNGRPDNLEAYLRAGADGRLKARVVGALWWDRGRGAEQIPELVQRRGDGAAGRFRPTSVKIMQDGVAENFTAGMTAPYLDACGCATGNAGLSFVDPAGLLEYVTRLDALGFQVHFHALGDRAVREGLDAIEAARAANGPTDGRHHLAHLQVVHPDDVPRFAALGATANLQPLWACHEPQMDELTIPFLGEPRWRWQYPFADLERAGARLAGGSDWSVSSPDVMWGVHVAVNRKAPPELELPGRDAPAFLPEQSLALSSALSAYTSGTAYVNHLDDVTGTLTVGKYADLALLDRNPFDGPAEAISATRVIRTWRSWPPSGFQHGVDVPAQRRPGVGGLGRAQRDQPVQRGPDRGGGQAGVGGRVRQGGDQSGQSGEQVGAGQHRQLLLPGQPAQRPALEHHGVGARMQQPPTDVAVRHRAQPVGRRPAADPAVGRGQGQAEIGQVDPDQFEHQLVQVGEVRVDARGGHPGLPGHPAQGGLGVPAAGFQQPARGSQQFGPQPAALTTPVRLPLLRHRLRHRRPSILAVAGQLNVR